MTKSVYHFIGIGGIGMSGLAKILLEKGSNVQGSDMATSYVTEGLKRSGAKVYVGHSEENIKGCEVVIYSSDIPHSNPEIQSAKKYQCELLHRSDLLSSLMKDHETLLVAGTHGKTTTSALLSHVLKVANFDPSFAVGGILIDQNTNARGGKGKFFVAEADESDGTFLKYSYARAIVTNIDTDHIAHYGSWENLIEAFSQFLQKATQKEHLFYCEDDITLKKLAQVGTSYGFSESAELKAKNFTQDGWNCFFDIHYKGKVYPRVQLSLVGKHNALNALAVFGLACSLNVPEADIRKAFSTFLGVKRRMEKKAEVQNVLFIDDYAHHPTEVQATLSALKNASQERRIIAVFQPHRPSRMRYVMDEFVHSFENADLLIVTDLYMASEAPIQGVSTESIIEKIEKVNDVPVQYIPRKDLAVELSKLVRPHDIVISLGAGDITKLSHEIQERLQKTQVTKLKVALLYGGMSPEHEVSGMSVKNFQNSINTDLYDVITVKISKDGIWSIDNENRSDSSLSDCSSERIGESVMRQLENVDVCIPVFHGPYGEDGMIQGFLEVLGKPFVGCDVRACSISMDKAIAKELAHMHGVQTLPFIACTQREWFDEKEVIIGEVKSKLRFPVFIKPSHLGSSIGVFKVTKLEDLSPHVEEAFRYDSQLLIEQGLENHREIEIAVLGNSKPKCASPGEILTDGNFYGYDDKYGSRAMQCTPKAELSQDEIAQVQQMALKVYRAIGCSGLARVDFFLDENGEYWFNEINPFPGFTANSLYPKMWESSHVPMSQLIDRLLILAMERTRVQQKVYHFSTMKCTYGS